MQTLSLTKANSLTDSLSGLLELHRSCFSDYIGVLPSESSFLDWYLKRPGLGEENVFIFSTGDTIVSALFLTLSRFRLGSDYLPVGIIDTVMTHPEFRRQGLASQLMKEAEKHMRKHGCRFGYLYTIPGTSQFNLYQRLGYHDHKRVFHLTKKSACQDSSGFPKGNFSMDKVQDFLNHSFRDRNGFVPLENSMWQWRKVNRPSTLPVRLVNVGENDLRSSITVGTGKITTGKGDWEKAAFLSDWAGKSPADLERVLQIALSTLPEGVVCDILCPVDNKEEWNILVKHGFMQAMEESAMLYPLDEEAGNLMEKHREGKWYPLIESVVGV